MCPTLPAARNSLSRSMSSLTPGRVLQGARWDYRILTPVKGDNTHISTVFRAKVVPRENAGSPLRVPQWFVIMHIISRLLTLTLPPRAFIKVALASDTTAIKNMDRERQTYRLPGVASAECFRKLYDVIDSSTIALEWLNTTLAEVKYEPNMHTYSLIAAVLRAALTSCVVLESHKCVNTGRAPDLEELASAN